MPRYIVQRSFPDGLQVPVTEVGAFAGLGVVARNADAHVTWLHSSVSADRKTTFRVYDGPDPEAIRKAAARNGCDGSNVCFLQQGAGCADDCDFGGQMACSERQDNTCQFCSYPETPCVWTDKCYLDTSICGDNGCGTGHAVCCQWEIGSLCYDDCDCCAELGCFGNLCLPLLTVDGAKRPRESSQPERPQPAKK